MNSIFITDTEKVIKRLQELGKAITEGREAILREFTMRIPAEPDRDADLILYAAAELLTKQARLSESGESLGGELEEREMRMKLEAENKKLREALEKYGGHLNRCSVFVVIKSNRICTCGLEEALKDK